MYYMLVVFCYMTCVVRKQMEISYRNGFGRQIHGAVESSLFTGLTTDSSIFN